MNRGESSREGGGQVPAFWPQLTAASQRAGGRQLGRQEAREVEDGTEEGRGEER